MIRASRHLPLLLAPVALAACGQAAQGEQAAPRESAAASASAAVASADVQLAAAGNGAAVAFDAQKAHFQYQMNCQGCHGPDGSGNLKRDVPPLHNLDRFLALREGREFLIRVPGMARSPLSDPDLTNLANWMVEEFSDQHGQTRREPYEVAEVSRLRNDPIVDGVVEHRAKLVARIDAGGVPTT